MDSSSSGSQMDSPEAPSSETTLTRARKHLVAVWHLVSWIWSILTYLVECFVILWAAWYYYSRDFYVLFGLTLAYFLVPSVVLMVMSLVWYNDLDRFYQKKKEESPQNPFVKEYHRKLVTIAIVLHVVPLGMVYRFGQLISLTLLGRTANIRFLHRDASLLRFMHGFLITAPQVVIHLYTVTVSANPDESLFFSSDIPLIALVACIVSLVYTVLAFTTTDRLSARKRRVVLSANVVQTVWYGFLVTSRIIAFGLFAHAYGAYVFVIVAVHWIAMFFGLLNLRTTFCSDVTTDPRKSRWYLEVPFDFVAACVYIFVYLNLKEGKTRIPVTVYHILIFIENTTMILLFYFDQSQLWYAPGSIAIVISFFLIGVFFMALYYLVFHPNKTETWYWVGVPRNGCHCCVWNRDTPTPESESRNRNVEISGPTLISLNGAAPTFPLARNTGPAPSQLHTSGIESRLPQNGNVKSETRYPTPHPGLSSRPMSTNTTGASIDSPISSLDGNVQSTSQSHSHYDTLPSASSFSPSKVGSNITPEGRSTLSDPVSMGNDTEFSSPSHTRFQNIPAKRPYYVSRLEQHYFPDGYHSNNATADKLSSPRRPPMNTGPDHFKFPSPVHRSQLEQSGRGYPPGADVQLSPQRNRFSYTPHSPERGRASGYQGRRSGIPTSTTLYGSEMYYSPQRERRAANYRNVNISRSESDRARYNQWKDRDVNMFKTTPEHTRATSWSSDQPKHQSSSISYGVTRSADKQTPHVSPERPKNVHWSNSVPQQQAPKRISWSVDRDTRYRHGDQFEQRPRAFSEGSQKSDPTNHEPAVGRGTSQGPHTQPARTTNPPGTIWLSDIKFTPKTDLPIHTHSRSQTYPPRPHNPLQGTGSHGNRSGAPQPAHSWIRQNPLIRMPTANGPVSQV